ncbi:hypothetical protein N8476_01945 [Akkermansiaceae bacterium]|nr:hypothetical protein [Akkermansiaceae bacterium]
MFDLVTPERLILRTEAFRHLSGLSAQSEQCQNQIETRRPNSPHRVRVISQVTATATATAIEIEIEIEISRVRAVEIVKEVEGAAIISVAETMVEIAVLGRAAVLPNLNPSPEINHGRNT